MLLKWGNLWVYMRNLAIDAFGDNILGVSNIPGGALTARHDLVKLAINSLILNSGIRAKVGKRFCVEEVINIQP